MRLRWSLVVPAAVGVAVLGATVYAVSSSHAIFRAQCREQCAASGLDYKVRALPGTQYGAVYPAECVCVARGEKRWWQLWR